MIKVKNITRNNGNFLKRISFYLSTGSIKIHLFLKSDTEELHNHPWNFKSLLILPYKEEIGLGNAMTSITKHKFFQIIERDTKTYHRVILYKIFGIEIPALTIGFYSNKEKDWNFINETN